MSSEISMLSKAPLIYVLVQVQHNPVLAVEKYVTSIQESVRKEYPRFQETVSQNIKLSNTGQDPEVTTAQSWNFSNKGQNSGFIIQADSIVYHTTDYENFDVFQDKVKFVIETVHNILELSLVERIGLRYIDYIQTLKAEDDLDRYFHPGLNGFPDIDGQKFRGLDHSEAQRPTSFGTIVLKLSKKRGGLIMPPDLGSVDLVIDRAMDEKKPNAILDIDHFICNSDDFLTDNILATVRNLHTVTSAAFLTIVSRHALDNWK